jgi:hypothetical protein
MNTERFRDLLDLRGAAIDLWPPAEREAARRLLASEAPARAALADAERLERLLARLSADDAGEPAAVGRVLARLADLPPQRRPFFRWFGAPAGANPARALWPQMAALAAVAGLGVLIGVSDLDAAFDGAVGGTVGSDVSTLVFDAEPTVVGLAQ